MLAKVRAKGDARARIMEIAEVFRVSIVDVTKTTLTVEASGKPEKLEALRELLSEYGIVELSRTGRIALARGDRGIREKGGLRVGEGRGRRGRVGVDGRRRLTGGGLATMATIYHEQDTDVSALAGQKIAVLGFGSQGHAHAQNLKDSGHDVRVGLRSGSSSRAKAEEAGLRVLDTADAVAEADVAMVPAARHLAREGLRRGHRAAPERRRHADVRARLLDPLRHGHAARRRRRHDDRAEGPRPPRAPDVRGGQRHARRWSRCSRTPPARRKQRALAYGAGIGARPRRHHRDDVQGGDRDRPLRRADGALRRASPS